MREPMIAWWPGKVPANRTSEALATTLDLLPTAAALSGAPLPDVELDGYNILPVLQNEARSPRDFFVFYRGDRVYAARLGPWKAHFLTQTAYPDGPVASHDPPVLYQLEHDPGERFDVAAEHADVITAIRNRLKEHYAYVGMTGVPSTEAENLLDSARPTGGMLRVQDMTPFDGHWSGDAQLWWVEAKPGDRLTLPLDVPKAGAYDIVGFFTRAKDYGIVRLLVNQQPVGEMMDGFSRTVEPTGPIRFGRTDLHAGTNEVTIELVGKDVRSAGYSDGYLVGIDGFQLRQ